MRKKPFKVHQLVHIETNHEEWGKLSTDAKVLELFPKKILVLAYSIRAIILVPRKDATHISPRADDPSQPFQKPLRAIADQIAVATLTAIRETVSRSDMAGLLCAQQYVTEEVSRLLHEST